MIRLLPLALRYAWFHRMRVAILSLAVCVSLAVPMVAALALRSFSGRLDQRAAETPMIVGAAGGRYDLLLAAFELKGRGLPPITKAAWDEIAASKEGGGAVVIPLHLGHTIQKHPLVGTSADYFPQHHLALEEGAWWSHLGEVVVGARAARELKLEVGSVVQTDANAWLDLRKALPMRLHVVGVLAANGSADDDAFFCDIPLCWISDGFGHGHVDPNGEHKSGALVQTFIEVTAENEKSFHFHGDQGTYPLSVVELVPRSQEAHTILLTRYAHDKPGLQALDGAASAAELLAQVRRAKRILDWAAAFFAFATMLVLGLVAALAWRERRGDRDALHKMGATRLEIMVMVSCDLWLSVLIGALLASILGLAALHWPWMPV